MTYRRVIHRFWNASPEMPPQFVEFGKKWEELNPGWIVMDHSEEVLQLWPDLADVFNLLYERDAQSDNSFIQEQVAEIVGYALIREFGGIYVSCSMEPIAHDIEQELPNMAWASYDNEDYWTVGNSPIGAPQPDNEFWTDLLSILPYEFFNNHGYVPSRLLTRLSKLNPELLYVFPKWAFNTTDSPLALAVTH